MEDNDVTVSRTIWEPVMVDNLTMMQYHCSRCDWRSSKVFPMKKNSLSKIVEEAKAHLDRGHK